MKITCLFGCWMLFEAFLYSAGANRVSFIYYSEGSTVLLRCPYFRHFKWIGPAHTRPFFEESSSNIHGIRRTWNVSAYSDRLSINSNMPHKFRLKVIKNKNSHGYDLQITNASVEDEGLYLCRPEFRPRGYTHYLFNMINASRIRYQYHTEWSTVILKCSQYMEWFGPAVHIFDSSMVDMHKSRSVWYVNRYTSGLSVFRVLPHHSRLEVIEQKQTGEHELRISNTSNFDDGLYFCENPELAGSYYYVLQIVTNDSLKEQEHSLEIIVLVVLLGIIVVLVVGIGFLFFHLKKKNKQRIISTINLETVRENDVESGHYMEIYMIDENILTPLQDFSENSYPNASTVEGTVVGNRDLIMVSAEHSSTSSDNDRNAQVYLEDEYEHPYNTLLPTNRDEDEHMYLSPKMTSNIENATPFENAACGCSYELTEQDPCPDQAKAHSEENDVDKKQMNPKYDEIEFKKTDNDFLRSNIY